MPALILHFGQQDELALERWRPGDPATLRLHADHFRVGMLGDLPDQRAPIAVWHPILRLDALVPLNALLKALLGIARLVRRFGHRIVLGAV